MIKGMPSSALMGYGFCNCYELKMQRFTLVGYF
jgi:hypothetical protein